MRIRTVEDLKALNKLVTDEYTDGRLEQDTVALTMDALNAIKQPDKNKEKNRNVALETAVELLVVESAELEASVLQTRQTEKQFLQLFSASRLPIAVYDLSGVVDFLHSIVSTQPDLPLAQHVASRPDLAGQTLEKMKPLSRNDALKRHLPAQSNDDDSFLLEKLSYRSIESFIDAICQLGEGAVSDSECQISLEFDTSIHHYHLAILPLAGHEAVLDRVLLIFTPISITHAQTSPHTNNIASIKEKLYSVAKKTDSIIVFNAEGAFLEISEGAKKTLGYRKSVPGHVDQLFVAGEDAQRFQKLRAESTRHPNQLIESHQQMECACADGRKLWVTYAISCLEQGEAYALFLNDVSASHRLLEHIRFQNSRDVLTNLYNRKEFKKHLVSALETSLTGEKTHALLLIDLDFFKIINDTLGHSAGDEFLRQLSLLLTRSVRANDIVARLGGDEFGILLQNCKIEIATRIAEGITSEISNHKFQWEDKLLPLTASVAIVAVDEKIATAEDCLAHGDTAVYAAKESGGNRYQLYDAGHELVAKHKNQLHWFSRIHAALEGNRFVLYAQKIDPLSPSEKEEGSHYELLIRMLGERGEIIPPGEFLPAAERYNLMPLIDRWVVRHAFEWLAANGGKRQIIGLCSINVSGASLCDDQFAEFVLKQFSEFGISGEKICFEITETMAIQNLQKTLEFIARMKALGCRFSLDDFGAGFSSYGHLRTLPVDFVKIDGQFVKQMAEDPIDFAMVKSINELGHLMQRKTIAEFVEDESTIEKLKHLGVDYAQGYGIERPERLGNQKGSQRKVG